MTTAYPTLPPIAGALKVDPDWLAVYVFYTGNPRPLLTTCIKPLVTQLVADRLITEYFFLNYWLEGPHVRVRFRPVGAETKAEVIARAEAAIGDFLRRRPSLYEVKSDFYVGLYNTLFDLEFDEEKRLTYSGPDGRMRLRANNSFSWEEYEPEYDKYGGAVGVRLAEWHFTQSTDLVLTALTSMNLHTRGVVLGFAAQLMMVMSMSFVDDDADIVAFLARYRDFWHSSFATTDLIAGRDFTKSTEAAGQSVKHRFEVVSTAIRSGAGASLPGLVGTWAAHCSELRGRVDQLSRAGGLQFRDWDGKHRETVTEPAEARIRLLSAYLHMTNNRMQVTMTDEAYLAHVLVGALGAIADVPIPALGAAIDWAPQPDEPARADQAAR